MWTWIDTSGGAVVLKGISYFTLEAQSLQEGPLSFYLIPSYRSGNVNCQVLKSTACKELNLNA